MTDTDRISQMAREAGLIEARDVWEALPKAYTDALLTLARLVAEDCAKVCDGMPYRAAGAGKAAQEIRARYGIE